MTSFSASQYSIALQPILSDIEELVDHTKSVALSETASEKGTRIATILNDREAWCCEPSDSLLDIGLFTDVDKDDPVWNRVAAWLMCNEQELGEQIPKLPTASMPDTPLQCGPSGKGRLHVYGRDAWRFFTARGQEENTRKRHCVPPLLVLVLKGEKKDVDPLLRDVIMHQRPIGWYLTAGDLSPRSIQDLSGDLLRKLSVPTGDDEKARSITIVESMALPLADLCADRLVCYTALGSVARWLALLEEELSALQAEGIARGVVRRASSEWLNSMFDDFGGKEENMAGENSDPIEAVGNDGGTGENDPAKALKKAIEAVENYQKEFETSYRHPHDDIKPRLRRKVVFIEPKGPFHISRMEKEEGKWLLKPTTPSYFTDLLEGYPCKDPDEDEAKREEDWIKLCNLYCNLEEKTREVEHAIINSNGEDSKQRKSLNTLQQKAIDQRQGLRDRVWKELKNYSDDAFAYGGFRRFLMKVRTPAMIFGMFFGMLSISGDSIKEWAVVLGLLLLGVGTLLAVYEWWTERWRYHVQVVKTARAHAVDVTSRAIEEKGSNLLTHAKNIYSLLKEDDAKSEDAGEKLQVEKVRTLKQQVDKQREDLAREHIRALNRQERAARETARQTRMTKGNESKKKQQGEKRTSYKDRMMEKEKARKEVTENRKQLRARIRETEKRVNIIVDRLRAHGVDVAKAAGSNQSQRPDATNSEARYLAKLANIEETLGRIEEKLTPKKTQAAAGRESGTSS